MLSRLWNSWEGHVAKGTFMAAVGLFAAAALVVGLAVLFAEIAEVFT